MNRQHVFISQLRQKLMEVVEFIDQNLDKLEGGSSGDGVGGSINHENLIIICDNIAMSPLLAEVLQEEGQEEGGHVEEEGGSGGGSGDGEGGGGGNAGGVEGGHVEEGGSGEGQVNELNIAEAPEISETPELGEEGREGGHEEEGGVNSESIAVSPLLAEVIPMSPLLAQVNVETPPQAEIAEALQEEGQEEGGHVEEEGGSGGGSGGSDGGGGGNAGGVKGGHVESGGSGEGQVNELNIAEAPEVSEIPELGEEGREGGHEEEGGVNSESIAVSPLLAQVNVETPPQAEIAEALQEEGHDSPPQDLDTMPDKMFFLKLQSKLNGLNSHPGIRDINFYDRTPDELYELYGPGKLYFFTPILRSKNPRLGKRQVHKHGRWIRGTDKHVDVKDGVSGVRSFFSYSLNLGKDKVKTGWRMYEYKINNQPEGDQLLYENVLVVMWMKQPEEEEEQG